ncbi:MFS transporter [Actinoallomurus sp. NPDC050550]|uniref:MFS transporter n=1 Tax=Actinoallomurus sp. NPDC050550 TaxID=3154937 RepID=UPI00340CB4C8
MITAAHRINEQTTIAVVRPWPAITAAALTATVTVMPGFAIGAMATPIAADLHLSRMTLGLAMSTFYAASALSSGLAKRLAGRLATPLALALPALITTASLLVVATAPNAAALVGALIVAGAGNSLVQPAAARLIAARAPAHRRALASGMVGAALGASSLIPALLVAFVVGPWGWRTAMLIASATALIPIVLARLTRDAPSTTAPVARPRSTGDLRGVRATLVLWAAAAALSAAGNNAAASYFIQLAHQAGFASGTAGDLLSASAILAVLVRLAAGAIADRAPRHNTATVAAMMVLGAIGLALIALGSPVSFLLGAILAFTAGWGWTGLLLATALRLVPCRAETAGHTVQVGVFSGATIAPYTFGELTNTLGFTTAALTTSAAALMGAALIVLGAKLADTPHTDQRSSTTSFDMP